VWGPSGVFLTQQGSFNLVRMRGTKGLFKGLGASGPKRAQTHISFYSILPIHKARSVQSWLKEHNDALQHFPWTAQSPDLNTIEPLWSVLESRVRSRFPSPSSLKHLADMLHEQWYRLFRTHMNLFQEGYKLYFMQMVAQLYISKEMCTFHNCFHNFVHPLYIQCGRFTSVL